MRDFSIVKELGNQVNRKFSKVFLVQRESDNQLFVLKIVEKNNYTILQQKKLFK
jgi:hypothetical protein